MFFLFTHPAMLPASRRLLIVCAALCASCYEYVPTGNPSSLVGQRVQLTLTDSGAVALASRIGPSIEALEGTLVTDSAASYQISMLTTRARSGNESDWRGEQIGVPHVLVSSLQARRFSPSRTALAGGLAAVGIVAITAGLRGAGIGGQGGPAPGPGNPQ